MNNMIEKRRHLRIYFTLEDGIFAKLGFPENKRSELTTNMLSLSEGGISFIFNKDNVGTVLEGEKILIKNILKPENLTFLNNVQTEVRHVVTSNEMNHLICGCQFLDLKNEIKLQIKELVENVSDEVEENISI